MVWGTFSGVAFVTTLLEALEAFIEVFAPLLRLEDEGFLLVWVWCRVFCDLHVFVFVFTGDVTYAGEGQMSDPPRQAPRRRRWLV